MCWLYVEAAQLEWKLVEIWYGEYVFTSCCGLCCFWKLKCDVLHCVIPEGRKSLSPLGVQSQNEDSCRMTVLDLEWGPDVHPEMWKSKVSCAGIDLKLDLQRW